MIMRKQRNNVESFERWEGKIDWKSQKINDCQTTRGSGIMGRLGTLNQKCASKGIKQTPHSNKIETLERRGGKDGMSETRNGNDDQKTADRKGVWQNNKWRRKSKVIDRRIKGRWVIKKQQREERWLSYLTVNKSSKGRKMTEIRTGEELNHRRKTRRGLSEDSIETRKRTRAEENLKVTECRDKDRKGKAVAKEEMIEEIYEIYDDSEDEEDLHELGRESREQKRRVGSRGEQQTSKEQQEQREERKRKCSGQKKGRGAGSMSDSGRGRGKA